MNSPAIFLRPQLAASMAQQLLQPSALDVGLRCGFHAIRPPSPLSSGQAFQGHLATCSTAIRPGSRSAATQGWHC
ncbi:hypothetical protein FA132_25895 [Pseudomonas aeruginosa]|nr:hypothetical protein [Pseudomonas aeruginosa]